MTKRVFSLITGFVGVLVACATSATEFPVKPIRIVSPFSAGGPTDTLARLIGQKLTERWGQPVIVDNKPGAGGNIGAEIVAKSAPDGYTLLIVASSFAVNASVYQKLPFDPVRHFSPIINVASGSFVLMVHPSVPAKSIAELIAFAKASPGKLSYASAGIGTANHLAGELFKTLAGVDILHVPYKGSPAATGDVLSGQVSMIFNNMISSMPYANTGRVRILAVTGPKRAAALPDVPTLAESGLSTFNVTGWYGILGPAGMPNDVVQRLNSEIARAIQLPELQASFRAQGVEQVGGNPESFAAFIRSEIDKWAEVVRAAGIKAE